jgi:isochorismate synthase
MSLHQLLDASFLTLLRRRLDALLASATAHQLISVTLDLGAGHDDWLLTDFSRTLASYWARPGHPGSYRLALGSAMIFSTAGPARFSALQAAFTGLTPVWLHDDSDHTGASPTAHIGFAFDEDAQSEQANARLVVPAILLQNRAGHLTATFSCTAHDADEAIERWRNELRAAKPRQGTQQGAQRKSAALLRKTDPLADRAFLARARAALADISTGKLEKIVLTRNTRLEAGEPIHTASLLATLNRRYPECTIFGFGNKGQSFVGATPERLVSLNGRMVQADALAGTAWIGTAANSGQPGSLRLQDDKNSREQQLVVDAVRAALMPLCTSLDQSQTPEIMQVRELQHLRTSVTGRVRDGIGLFDLIERLHPTPAVGGTPRIAARQWLRTHGEQRGAWYTGGIGWIERSGDGEIVVPLRCARIAGAQAELFAGAGIVAGSDPAQELAETEAKFNTIIEALQHAVLHDGRTDSDAERTGTQ